jgi:hypothetical protein
LRVAYCVLRIMKHGTRNTKAVYEVTTPYPPHPPCPPSPFIKGEGGQGVVPKGGRGVVGKGD